jgi:hypothetical protein
MRGRRRFRRAVALGSLRRGARILLSILGFSIASAAPRAGFLRGMRALGAFGVASLLAACIETAPGQVVLTPAGEKVEIVGEAPNLEVYKAVGEVHGEAMGSSTEAQHHARRMLRNQAAAKGAHFVAIEDFTARQARDLSGRTVVVIVGQAYRPKD